MKLLRQSKSHNDLCWRNARRLLEFPEIKAVCLGYGADSVAGSGSGSFTTDRVISTAKEIIDLAIDDPDMFASLGLLEEGIGPDRISDMVCNIILKDLISFNDRILKELAVPREEFSFQLKSGEVFNAHLPRNNFAEGHEPILLVPVDILRELPISADWGSVARAAKHNSQLRERFNSDLGFIWERASKRDKKSLRDRALESHASFETFLEMLKGAGARPYDIVGDKFGEIAWRRIAHELAAQQPFRLQDPEHSATGLRSTVDAIIAQFKFLIEERRLSEELYANDRPRIEKASQRLFFAVSYAYCKANNIDVTPEADTNNVPVDFKFSTGFDARVVVEIKLSRNSKLVEGYQKQLATYETAEETQYGYYIVIDVGSMGDKDKRLYEVERQMKKRGRTSPIIMIDGRRRPSASKL